MEHPPTQSDDLNSPDKGKVNHTPEFREAVAKGYEPKDIGLSPVFKFIGGLVVTMVVVMFAIYAIVMAMAASYRKDMVNPSPVAVKLPPVYAPLQPSLGFYDNHDQDHDKHDAEDMADMRYKTRQILSGSGENPVSHRKWEPIDVAMNDVLEKNLLVVKPVPRAVAAKDDFPPAGPGSYEGFLNDSNNAYVKPTGRFNDMNTLNNQGN